MTTPYAMTHHEDADPVADLGRVAVLMGGASAERAVSLSFQTLAERMSVHGVEVATGLAREMMQPMLKAWLDENLPPIVDRLVKAEIERLTAGWR